MKKQLISILSIFLLFSIVNFTFAKENYGYIGDLLDLKYGVEELKIEEIHKIDYIKFYNAETQNQFDNLVKANEILKDEFIRMYKDGEIDYNSINYIIKNYNLFIYHTNKVFFYKSIKEIKPNYKELNDAIISNFTLAKSYYTKVRNTIKRNLKKF